MTEQKKTFGETLSALIKKGNRNRFTVYHHEQKIFSIRITLFILLLIFFCPAALILMLIGLFCNCKFHFSGPDFPENNQLNTFFEKLSGLD